MLEMAINNVEVGSEKDRVHIVTFCGPPSSLVNLNEPNPYGGERTFLKDKNVK